MNPPEQPSNNSRTRRYALVRSLYTAAASLIAAIGIALFVVPLIPLRIEAATMPVRDLGKGARSVHIHGFDLWYRAIGRNTRNPPIVVLHGGPGMSDHYFNNVFDFLGDTRRVIYYDQRGSGFSEIKRNPRYYRFQYLVDDLEALRRNVIHRDKIVLAAHSFGGMIAMKYAVDHPEHVAGLILISSMPPRDWGERLDPGDTQFDDWFMQMDPVSRDRMFLQSYNNSIGDSLYNPSSGIAPDIGYMSYVPSRLLWDSSQGYDYTKGLSSLSAPSLIIYGIADTFVDRVPLYLHSVLKNSTLVRFDRSGHWTFIEEPERFKAVVKGFLGK